jgi:hypothetical protein
MQHARGVAERNRSLLLETQVLRLAVYTLSREVKLLRGGGGLSMPRDDVELVFSLVLEVESAPGNLDYAQLRKCARVSRGFNHHVRKRVASWPDLSMCGEFVDFWDVTHALEGLPSNLQSLDLSKTRLVNSLQNAQTLTHVILDAGLTQLRSFALSAADLDSGGMGVLGRVFQRNTALESLNLSGNPQLGGLNFAKALSGLTRLKVLDISCTSVSPQAIGRVLANTSVLVTLCMRGWHGDGAKTLTRDSSVSLAFFEGIRQQTSLESLDISRSGFHKYPLLMHRFSTVLLRTPRMRSLFLSMPHGCQCFPMGMHSPLLLMRMLERLDLTNVPEDGWDILNIFGACIEWPRLKVLCLEAALNVTSRTCRSLVCMSSLPALQDLRLVSSPRMDSRFSRWGASTFCEALSQWTSLEVLELGSINMQPDSVKDLCKTLAGLPRLRRLRVKVLGKDVGALRAALEPKVRVTF